MSLDRKAVVTAYKQLSVVLNLDHRHIVLSAGAALVMLGLRKYTNDLDVDVPAEYYDRALMRKPQQDGLTGSFVAFDGITDLHRLPDDFTRADVVDVQGVQIYSVERLIAQKEMMRDHPKRNKEKIPQDTKDIKALKELLDNVNNTRSELDAAGLTLHKRKINHA